MAAELGEGTDKALETLEAAIKKQPKDADLRYDAARAFSLASRLSPGRTRRRSKSLSERSLSLLREAVENDDADFGTWRRTPTSTRSGTTRRLPRS